MMHIIRIHFLVFPLLFSYLLNIPSAMTCPYEATFWIKAIDGEILGTGTVSYYVCV